MNFALGDWFPLGATASRRYAFLNRVPLLPHEELLCKEAMRLCKCLELEDPDFPSLDLISHNSTKISFVNLMRFQHCARWFLMKSRVRINLSLHSHGTILCSLCKRDCYLAYVDCNCHEHPVCVRHGKVYSILCLLLFHYELDYVWLSHARLIHALQFSMCLVFISLSNFCFNILRHNDGKHFLDSDVESLAFKCGSKHTLRLREDIVNMEDAAKKFEQEDGVLEELSKQTETDQNMYSYPLSDLFQRAEANGYVPYCELKLDSDFEFYTTPEQSNNQECATQSVFRHSSENYKEVSDVSFSSAASTLCSLSEPLESSSAPRNVISMTMVLNIVIVHYFIEI